MQYRYHGSVILTQNAPEIKPLVNWAETTGGGGPNSPTGSDEQSIPGWKGTQREGGKERRREERVSRKTGMTETRKGLRFHPYRPFFLSHFQPCKQFCSYIYRDLITVHCFASEIANNIRMFFTGITFC